MKPTNNIEALALALHLTIEAPTDEKSQEALYFAELLAECLNDIEIQQAKKLALTY